MRTSNHTVSSRANMLGTLSASALLLLLLGSSSFLRVNAFGAQHHPLSSSPSTRRSSSSRTTQLHVSSTTPPPPSPGPGFFNNIRNKKNKNGVDDMTSSAFPFFQSSNVWSNNDTSTDNSRRLLQNEKEESFVNTNMLLPVLSSALLITGSTFGAGSLVLPELAQGPGLANTFGLFLGAYAMNLISGLCIAQVAIEQKNKLDRLAAAASSAAAGDSGDLEQQQQNKDVPCSFKEFVESTTGSHALATFISAVSFSVNSLVWAFVLSRVGLLASQVTHGFMSSSVAVTVWAAALVSIFATQTPGRISHGASVCITPALFASFGSLLVPGLAAVPDDFLTVMSQPGLAENPMSSMAALAPVVYMSTIYQNIVPTVAKLQNYHPTRTLAAILLGSLIPLIMYLSWCYACLGGGIDLEALTSGGGSGGDATAAVGMAGPLLTVFSLATLAGSSIGCGMSCASEINTFVKATLNDDNIQDDKNDQQVQGDDRFSLPTVLASVGLPLAICHVFGHGGDLTGALSVAGGLGSPLLYGIIPVVMAWKQSQQKNQEELPAAVQRNKSDSFSFMPSFLRQHNKASMDFSKQMAASAAATTTTSFVPASSLGVLGVFSTGMLGSEIVGQVSQVFAVTTATVPVSVVEQVEEMAMAMVAPL